MRPARPFNPARERGVVLIFTLIILVILTIGAVALVRSMNTSLFSAGNLAFRRDLVNQGELGTSAVLKMFEGGGALVNNTSSNVPASNYSASMLATNAQGIPTAMLSDAAFSVVGQLGNDIAGAGATSDVKIRYLVDRLCSSTGAAVPDMCVQATAAPNGGGGTGSYQSAPVNPPSSTVYRLTVRVLQANRNTAVFLQSTIAEPN